MLHVGPPYPVSNVMPAELSTAVHCCACLVQFVLFASSASREGVEEIGVHFDLGLADLLHFRYSTQSSRAQEDEFSGMGGSTKNTGGGSRSSSNQDGARSAAQQLAAGDSSVEFSGAASLGAVTGAGAVGGGDVPQVLVQFCVS